VGGGGEAEGFQKRVARLLELWDYFAEHSHSEINARSGISVGSVNTEILKENYCERANTKDRSKKKKAETWIIDSVSTKTWTLSLCACETLYLKALWTSYFPSATILSYHTTNWDISLWGVIWYFSTYSDLWGTIKNPTQQCWVVSCPWITCLIAICNEECSYVGANCRVDLHGVCTV
jgi:hypothetical protein